MEETKLNFFQLVGLTLTVCQMLRLFAPLNQRIISPIGPKLKFAFGVCILQRELAREYSVLIFPGPFMDLLVALGVGALLSDGISPILPIPPAIERRFPR
jgi:hypothetical protein